MKVLTHPSLLQQARELAEAARDRGAQPRVHPNSFIQLDLKPPTDERWHEGKQAGHSGADLRLHIWNPPDHPLPHQDTVNEIHDHVFDMKSTVVRGSLGQLRYRFVVGSGVKSAELYRAVYDRSSSSRLEPLGVYGALELESDDVIHAGQSYMQPAFTLHDSEPGRGLVVTLMEKLDIHEGIPTVVCPLGQPPDNDFDRATAAPQDFLWSAIWASLA